MMSQAPSETARTRRPWFSATFLALALATASLTAAAVTGAVLAAPAAHAANDTRLPLPAYGDLVVDPDHRRVFVSGGPASNGLVVTDLGGRVIRTIENQYGATGLVLSADYKRLYVALAAGDAISVIDTHTLKELTRYPSGAQTCPTHLARTGGTVWFGHGCDGIWNGGVGKLDTTVAAPTATTNVHGDVRFQRAPLLTARDAAAGPLVAGQPELSLSTVYVYTITDTGALTQQAASTAPGSNLNDIGLDKYGATLFTGAGSRNAAPAYATADLSGRGSYYTGYYPLAVAATPDGFHIAVGVRATGDDVYVYEIGGLVPERRLDLTSDVLVPRGLTWSPDSDTLYAVTQSPGGGQPTLRVVSNPV